jgi:hypothetical protein
VTRLVFYAVAKAALRRSEMTINEAILKGIVT